MRDWLLDGFRYDLWANRRWAPVAMGNLIEVSWPTSLEDVSTEPQARLETIFTHIVWAQRMWLRRLGVSVVAEGVAWLDALHESWIGALNERNPAEIVAYRNTKGVPFTRPVGDIAWHVVNHGTYHRGQLREIAERAGIEYPETDLTVWRNSP